MTFFERIDHLNSLLIRERGSRAAVMFGAGRGRRSSKLDTRSLPRPALEGGVVFMHGQPFLVNPDCDLGYLQLNFSHAAPGRLAGGLRRLAEVICQATPAAAA